MLMSEAVDRVLLFLEQTDEEEYTRAIALEHLNQAIFELTDKSELSELDVLTNYEVNPDDSNSLPAIPGRELLTTVLASTDSGIGYIKEIWLSVGTESSPFEQTTLEDLLGEYGDSVGTPEKWATDGTYLYWRPFQSEEDGVQTGDTITFRVLWHSLPTSGQELDSPVLLQKAPYACIYRACAIGALWLMDDGRDAKFYQLADAAFADFCVRSGMSRSIRLESEEYNG
jgi:hypothetical protein